MEREAGGVKSAKAAAEVVAQWAEGCADQGQVYGGPPHDLVFAHVLLRSQALEVWMRRVLPSPATHAILILLKAGGSIIHFWWKYSL